MSNSRVIHSNPESGIYAIERIRSYAQWDSYGDNYYSQKKREITVYNNAGLEIKFFETEFTSRGYRAIFIDKVKKWMSEYWVYARYNRGEEHRPKCDNFLRIAYGGPCSNLRVGEDGRAKCAVDPVSGGWFSTQHGARDVPKDAFCDIFKRMYESTARLYGGNVPGVELTMYEIWKCYTGEAYKEIKGDENATTSTAVFDIRKSE